ncbi:MAG: SAM-dependent methyltransferase [Dehalococcoidia bacterium]|nr:SAM-dependent methyltransferase [Dehalococcoidia bacterium]
MQTGTPSEAAGMNAAEIEIRQRISQQGAITFAEFMELALYHPEGYYSADSRIGARGDYFTSPSLHPTFGALLAVQLKVMWDTLDRPHPFWVVESGVGGGHLATDIQSFANVHMREFAKALHYVEVDRSTRIQPTDVGPHTTYIQASCLPLAGMTGCILTNELLDSFPVHRFRIADGQVQEMYVTLGSDGRFREEYCLPSNPRISDRLSTLPRQLPDGFCGEVNLSLEGWISDAAAALDRGYVLTIDYGYEAAELYSDARPRGTLQTYYKHVDGSSPYQRVGRQDMTAHVDFSALIAEGLNAGLRPVFLTTQAEFLQSLGFDAMVASMGEQKTDHLTKTANLRAMNELVKPDGLGRFKVLVQEKNSGIERSSDLLPHAKHLTALRTPLMTASHLYAEPDTRYRYEGNRAQSIKPSMRRLSNRVYRTIM